MRSLIRTLLLALAILAPMIASPVTPSYAETRVWGFELEEPARASAQPTLSETCIEGYPPTYDEVVVGCSPVPRWPVDPSFRKVDEAAGLIVDGKYIKNPSATNLKGLLTETGKIESKHKSGQFMYVVDELGEIIIDTRSGRMPHPTLVGGTDPEVRAAGIVDVRGGRVYSVDNASGHFKPGAESLKSAQSAFGQLPPGSFHKDFQGYRKFKE